MYAFTGLFTDVGIAAFTGAFADVFTGAFPDVFTGVFSDLFTGVPKKKRWVTAIDGPPAL